MTAEITTALIGAGAALAVAIVAGGAAAIKVGMDLQAKFDEELRSRRLDAYLALWRCLAPLAQAEPDGPRSHQKIAFLAKRLRDWYFGGGGLLLSGTERSRGVPARATPEWCIPLKPDERPPDLSYQRGSVLAFMQLYWDVQRAAKHGEGVDGLQFECLRKHGSSLRTALTVDVGSRKVLNLRRDGM